MWNCKSKNKLLREQIEINKFRVCMILRARKIPRAHLKINKGHGMVMFVSINAVENYALQTLNARAQNRKLSSVR